MKKVTFIINGTAKRKERVKKNLRENLSVHEVNFLETTFAGEAVELAQKAIEGGTNYLIAVGGDGSVNEVVNGCMKCDAELLRNVTVGVYPYGSGNDFVKSLGVTKDIAQLNELINNDRTSKVDIGKVDYVGLNDQAATRHYMNIMDVGIGGDVTELLSRSSRFMGAQFNYHKAILQSFLTYKPVEVSLKSDDFSWKGQALSLIMANGRFFANGMCIAPQASISDGMVQLVIMGKVSVWDYIKNMSKVKRGEIIDDPEITYVKVNSCSIDAQPKTCPIDMDGEFIGYAPLNLTIIKGGLNFLAAN